MKNTYVRFCLFIPLIYIILKITNGLILITQVTIAVISPTCKTDNNIITNGVNNTGNNSFLYHLHVKLINNILTNGLITQVKIPDEFLQKMYSNI